MSFTPVPAYGQSPGQPRRVNPSIRPVGLGNVPGFQQGEPVPGTTPQPAPGPTQVSSATSPYLQEHIDRYRQRFDQDNTKRAIDKSNLGIMDAAALGAADMKANLSRRGVLNSGTGAKFLQKNVFEPAQRQAAEAASNIALKREQDLDALVLGGTSIMRAPDEVSLANRGLGLQQLNSDREDLRYRAQLEQEERRRREEAARWQAMVGSVGSYAPPRVTHAW